MTGRRDRRPGGPRRDLLRPGRRWLPGLAAVALVLATPLLGGAPAAPAAATAAGGASSTAGLLVPSPGNASDLYGVNCTSSSNCWFVGRYLDTGGAYFNQILHWNMGAWSLVFSPQPGGTANGDFNELASVACTSASNCWAVGNDIPAGGVSRNQAQHWNGTKWSLVATPEPGPGAGLAGVRCTSSSNCWAVGSYANASGARVNEALRWSGAKWSLVSTPQPGGTTSTANHNELDGVGCASASNCWAVGWDATATIGTAPDLNLALHWNGTKWSLAGTPEPAGTAAGDRNLLSGVSCASSSSCWAVGLYGTTSPRTSLTQALFWNGTAWSLAATPDPDGTGGANELIAVNCTSPANCWAVGDYGSISAGAGVIVNLALHWDGTTWTQVSTPDPGGLNNNDANFLDTVRCISATSCWAAGNVSAGGGADLNQALVWNGTAWSAG
jgi:hypothetical protein